MFNLYFMENNLKTLLFTEQLRPSNLESVILTQRVRSELSKGLQDHIMLVGPAGTGKTTCSRILAQNHDTLTINGSLERGIETIRDKVIMFAGSSSLLGGVEQLKVIVLEECDNLTNDAWMSLRATIEKYHKTVRFIANCNYVDKIPEPIQSRFNVIQMAPISKDEETYLIGEYKKRAALVLSKCGIAYNDESLNTFIMNDFPDMRSIIKKIQQFYIRGDKELVNETTSGEFTELFKMLITDVRPSPWDNYKTIVSNWGSNPDNAMLVIGKEFPEFLRTYAPQKVGKLPLVIIDIADYQRQFVSSIDKLVTLLAMCFKIQLDLQMN